MESLPEVAKSFNTYCKKCDTDRYHKVIAHKTATSAKLECEVCKKKSTYSLAKKRQRSFEPKKAKDMKLLSDWTEAKALLKKDAAVDYSIKNSFNEKATILHSKFGYGYVMRCEPTKIEVIFEDGVKTLVQNR